MVFPALASAAPIRSVAAVVPVSPAPQAASARVRADATNGDHSWLRRMTASPGDEPGSGARLGSRTWEVIGATDRDAPDGPRRGERLNPAPSGSLEEVRRPGGALPGLHLDSLL